MSLEFGATLDTSFPDDNREFLLMFPKFHESPICLAASHLRGRGVEAESRQLPALIPPQRMYLESQRDSHN